VVGKTKIMKSTMPQHCISVMRAEWLKMSIFAPKKLCGRWTVNCSETRTTLILDRCGALKKTAQNEREFTK